TLSDQPQYLYLPGAEGWAGEAGMGVPRLARGTGPGAGQEGGSAVGIEPFVIGQGGRAVAGPLGPGVGGSEDPSPNRHAVAAEPERIAGAVEALMAVADVSGQVGEGADLGKDALGVVGVQAERLREGGCSTAGCGGVVSCLLQQACWYGDFAEVVDQPGSPETVLLPLLEPELGGGQDGQVGHRARVCVAPGGLEVDEVGQRLAHGQAPVA